MNVLPLSAKVGRLLWDMDLTKVDIDTHKKAIIERVLNIGTLADWSWLKSTYGTREVSNVLAYKAALGRDNLRPQARRLASLVFK